MTTEDAFRQALEANPADTDTRLILADWLEEQEPPRSVEARGQRWQVVNRQWPQHYRFQRTWTWWLEGGSILDDEAEATWEADLPFDVWFELADWVAHGSYCRDYRTLRAAETALAHALASLDL